MRTRKLALVLVLAIVTLIGFSLAVQAQEPPETCPPPPKCDASLDQKIEADCLEIVTTKVGDRIGVAPITLTVGNTGSQGVSTSTWTCKVLTKTGDIPQGFVVPEVVTFTLGPGEEKNAYLTGIVTDNGHTFNTVEVLCYATYESCRWPHNENHVQQELFWCKTNAVSMCGFTATGASEPTGPRPGPFLFVGFAAAAVGAGLLCGRRIQRWWTNRLRQSR